MNYKERIYEAWQFTQNNKKMILWYGLLPSFITTVFGICYTTYQIMAFKTSPIFSTNSTSFTSQVGRTVIDFLRNNFSLTGPIIITAIIVFIIYMLAPVILESSMIQVIARRKNGQTVNLLEGLQFGLLRFLQLFEYSLMMRTFNILSIFGIISTIVRNFGMSAFETFLPLIITIFIVGIVLNILFTFSEYFIVIDEEGVMAGVVKSCTTVILNLQKTMMLVILMLIIGIRIVIQLILVILIPVIGLAGFAFFATTSLPEYAIYIFGGLTFAFIIFASYLAAVVYVFATAVWTFTFLDFTAHISPTAREKGEITTVKA